MQTATKKITHQRYQLKRQAVVQQWQRSLTKVEKSVLVADGALQKLMEMGCDYIQGYFYSRRTIKEAKQCLTSWRD
ncbi:hypothetical protein [Vibrio sp. ES.051]|uniref:hypothetical protein n=1 Tax=Vibrio sp. ES.051 TaxID=1761909 RepID=UPI000BF4B724|nr:hypothetical protein [Vibrio sp. ES.051]